MACFQTNEDCSLFVSPGVLVSVGRQLQIVFNVSHLDPNGTHGGCDEYVDVPECKHGARLSRLGFPQVTSDTIKQNVPIKGPAAHSRGRWLAEVLLQQRVAMKITRPGFEPGRTESKSVVLPLHYRVGEASH